MCGILGWVRPAGKGIDIPMFNRALNRIRHRGPDDEGYLLVDTAARRVSALAGRDTPKSLSLPTLNSFNGCANVALGHRRLSIIDLSTRGRQPMVSSDGQCWVVFNGEIYNYLELRERLRAEGAHFTTESDTEVLLAAYQAWGVQMLPKLIGMFALVILDLRRRAIFLARDPFGIKPLYVTHIGTDLAFSSEIKALLVLPGVVRRADAGETLQQIRYGERHGFEKTLLTSIRRFPAASYGFFSLDHCRLDDRTVYWRPNCQPSRTISFSRAVDEARMLLRESIRYHLRSDVTVGACLSGGLDSASLAALMRERLPASVDIHAFSYISDVSRFSEEKWVDMVSGVVKHKVRPEPTDLARDMPRLLEAQELPFMNLGAYAQFRVFELANRAGIKVMLDGQGADEIFGGYPALLGARITSALLRGNLATASQLVRSIPSTLPGMRTRTLLTSIGRCLPRPLQQLLVPLMDGPVYPSYLRHGWFEARDVHLQIRMHGQGRSAFKGELELGIEHLTLPQLLRYEDGSSMHFSIESRVPYCVPALADFALSLPDEYLISERGLTKAVLRTAMQGLVPEGILTREKLGFSVPDRDWLNSCRRWVMTQVSDEHRDRFPFLDLAAARTFVLTALEGKGYWTPQVWSLLGLVAWAIHYDVHWE